MSLNTAARTWILRQNAMLCYKANTEQCPARYYDVEFTEFTPASQHCCCLNFLVKRWRLSWLANIRNHPNKVSLTGLLHERLFLIVPSNSRLTDLRFSSVTESCRVPQPNRTELGPCWSERVDLLALVPQFRGVWPRCWCWSSGDNVMLLWIQKLARMLLPSQNIVTQISQNPIHAVYCFTFTNKLL